MDGAARPGGAAAGARQCPMPASRCSPVCSRLQPYVLEAATLCAPRCNPTCSLPRCTSRSRPSSAPQPSCLRTTTCSRACGSCSTNSTPLPLARTLTLNLTPPVTLTLTLHEHEHNTSTSTNQVRQLLESFGAKRLMWGSDFPFVLLGGQGQHGQSVPLLGSASARLLHSGRA